MPIQNNDPRPLYEQLANELRDAIAAGTYQPQDQLPSNRQLVEQHGIAPMTVQRAIHRLRDDGIVVPCPGRGVYVADAEQLRRALHTPRPPKSFNEAVQRLAETEQQLEAALADLAAANATQAQPR